MNFEGQEIPKVVAKPLPEEERPPFQTLACLNEQGATPSTPFLQTNEEVYSHTYNYLAITRKYGVPTLHVGVSGLQNLDMIAARRSNFGVLLDINPNMQKIMSIVRDICRSEPKVSRQEFVSAFINQISTDSELWDDETKKEFQLSNFRRKAEESWSWLSSEDSFNHVRALFLEDKITSINLNFSNVEKVERIARRARQNGVAIDTVYISNIFEWNTSENAKKLVSLARVGQEDTLILSSYGPRGELQAYELRDHPYFHIDHRNGVASLTGSLKDAIGSLSTTLE
jgi:hypothetical protein